MISEKSAQQIVRTNSHAMFPYLIEIEHDDFGVMRYANTDIDITFEGNTYIASWFKISPPKKEAGTVSNAQISMSAIDQEWIQRIRNTRKRAKIRFIACVVLMDGEYKVEAIEDNSFTLTSVSWNDTQITWDMIFDDTMQVNLPCDIATAQKVPGIA